MEKPLIQIVNATAAWPPCLGLLFSPRLSVTINRKKNMVVSFGDGISFVIILHQVWKPTLSKQAFTVHAFLNTHICWCA